MSLGLKEYLDSDAFESEMEEKKPKGPDRKKKEKYPMKRTMNLYYKPDRTTKPATIALYALFTFACLLGFSKVLIYDVWMETRQAQRTLAAAEEELSSAMLELIDYNEVQERYYRYSAIDEERALVDRMEILALLDNAVGAAADMNTISISGGTVQIQFSGVTLAQTAGIVRELEAFPIVAGTVVNTAFTTQEGAVLNDISAPVRANVLIYLQKEAAE